MKNIISALFLLCFISCNNRSNEWMAYNTEIPSLGQGDQKMYLKLNDSTSTYVIHWLIYDGETNSRMFTRMSFSNEYIHEGNEISLPFKLITNEAKLSNGQQFKFPLDQNPDFHYSTNSNELTVYGVSYAVDKEYSNAYIKEQLLKHESWDGEEVIF